MIVSAEIRNDVQILERDVKFKNVIYLDTSDNNLMPNQVIDAF